MRISDWSSDVCSSDLVGDLRRIVDEFSSFARMPKPVFRSEVIADIARHSLFLHEVAHPDIAFTFDSDIGAREIVCDRRQIGRSEEHTSELRSLMRISYAVFCLKKKITILYTT